MATRSLFHSFRRVLGKAENDLHSSQFSVKGGSSSRFCSSSAVRGEEIEEPTSFEEKDDLKSRIFRLRLPKRSATTVLEKWIGGGNRMTTSELREISRELRKSQRYKHALEISEWMVQHEEFEMSDVDYAVQIDLMSKVFGIDAAERYFEGLPPTAQTSETYTALLHSYASLKLIDRAENLFERIKESNLSFSAITYNEMMTLYMSVGQVEKVSHVVEELKQKRVSPDIFTYNLWISSCAAALNIDAARRVLDEMGRDSGLSDSWVRYVNLVNIYISAGRLVNTNPSSPVEADKGITQREWITYDFLIILYAGLGNNAKIDQIWKSLRMTKQQMTTRNYICILSSYLMLGHLREAGDVIDQWKQCTAPEFDLSVCRRVLDAFGDVGLAEKVVDFETLLIQKNCSLEHE